MRYLNTKGDVVNFHTPFREVTNYFPAVKLTMSVLTITPEIRLKAERLGVVDFKKYLGNALYSGNCLITATLEPATSSTDIPLQQRKVAYCNRSDCKAHSVNSS